MNKIVVTAFEPFGIIPTNSSLEILKTLKPLKIINFRKNFGQTAAMDAGFKMANGKYIAALDGDGQNDPNDIINLINKLEKDDLDVVSGWRKNRKDNFQGKFSGFYFFYYDAFVSSRNIIIVNGFYIYCFSTFSEIQEIDCENIAIFCCCRRYISDTFKSTF